jgi:hypothetical protein
MSATTFGISGVVFGVSGLNGFVVSTATFANKVANQVNIEDENGNVVHRRFDDAETEISVDMKFAGGTIPTVGTTFTYAGVEYIVTAADVKRENKGFQTVGIKGLTSEYITLS